MTDYIPIDELPKSSKGRSIVWGWPYEEWKQIPSGHALEITDFKRHYTESGDPKILNARNSIAVTLRNHPEWRLKVTARRDRLYIVKA